MMARASQASPVVQPACPLIPTLMDGANDQWNSGSMSWLAGDSGCHGEAGPLPLAAAGSHGEASPLLLSTDGSHGWGSPLLLPPTHKVPGVRKKQP